MPSLTLPTVVHIHRDEHVTEAPVYTYILRRVLYVLLTLNPNFSGGRVVAHNILRYTHVYPSFFLRHLRDVESGSSVIETD